MVGSVGNLKGGCFGTVMGALVDGVGASVDGTVVGGRRSGFSVVPRKTSVHSLRNARPEKKKSY